MLEWQSPGWLAGLALLPLIRWLHRFDQGRTPRAVSALFLWPRTPAPSAPATGRRPPSPWWRYRALLFALLMLALAQPAYRAAQPRPLTIWLDTQAGMQALEGQRTRLQQAIDDLPDLVASAPGRDITLRLLQTRPGAGLRLTPGRPIAADRLRDWVRSADPTADLPLPARLNGDAEHWLISDGTRPGLADWLVFAPIQRVIGVGSATENSGIALLALRPTLADPDRVQGLLALFNAGTRPDQRTLRLSEGQRLLDEWPLTLPAGEFTMRTFDLGGSRPLQLRAVLAPGDALPGDDDLVLGYAPPALAVSVDPRCDPQLGAALSSLPLDLRHVEVDPELAVSCSEPPSSTGPPALWFMPATTTSRPPPGIPAWRSGTSPLDAIRFDAGTLKVVADAVPRGEPLLRSGADILVAEDPAHRLLSVAIDMGDPGWQRQAEFPLLVAGLAERALGRPLQDPLYRQAHDPQWMHIAPRALPSGNAAHAASPAPATQLDTTLLAAAGLLMLGDILWLWPRRRPVR